MAWLLGIKEIKQLDIHPSRGHLFENWIRWDEQGQLTGGKYQVISEEQMELARLRAELARVKMERDILKKATAYFAKESL
jgi:transposase